jgi:UDP-GlcNAc:undecaprenyl-phosphate GlcNAc-1-phosphate transferase
MALALTAAGISLAWCGVALWVGPRTGFVDRPERSHLTVHDRPVVPLGGVGLYLAFNLAVILEDGVDPGLLIASTLVLFLGLIDDRVGLRPELRLAVEIVAAGVLVLMSDLAIPDVPDLLLSVVLVVVAINAVNLYDGLDGLAGSTALVSGLGIALLATGRGSATGLSLVFVGALVGFLVFNWHPARVFLGDSGAYLTGLFLVYLVLDAGASSGEMLVGFSLLGVFLVDLAASVIRRLRVGRGLFAGDRSHLYDQMRDRGHSVPTVALLSAAVQCVIVLVVVVLDRTMTSLPALAVIVAIALGILGLLARIGLLTPVSD